MCLFARNSANGLQVSRDKMHHFHAIKPSEARITRETQNLHLFLNAYKQIAGKLGGMTNLMEARRPGNVTLESGVIAPQCFGQH